MDFPSVCPVFLFFSPLPPSLSYSPSQPPSPLTATLWPFVSTSSESRWCFLKPRDKLTGQPSIERGGGEPPLWTTMCSNFLQLRFNVHWRDGSVWWQLWGATLRVWRTQCPRVAQISRNARLSGEAMHGSRALVCMLKISRVDMIEGQLRDSSKSM